MQEKEQCQGQRKGGNNVNIVLSSQSTSAEQRQFSQLTPLLSQGSGAAATAPTATATQQAGVMGKFKLRPVQATTLGHMAEIRKRVNSARVLVVQPCGTGKSLYFTNFAKTKDTIVILAQPFVSLTQQTTTDAITSKISTSTQAGIPLKQMVLSEGLLIISSYEKLHTLVFCLSPFYLSIYGKKRLMHLLQGDAG
jgi:superfamily II DNA or RNA helicase